MIIVKSNVAHNGHNGQHCFDITMIVVTLNNVKFLVRIYYVMIIFLVSKSKNKNVDTGRKRIGIERSQQDTEMCSNN